MESALVVIDVQNYFVNDKTKDLPRKISQFINKNKFDFILFTKFVNKKDSNFLRLLGWKKMLSAPDTNIHSNLRKFATEENTFDKTAFSVFKAKGFKDFLERNRIRKLFLCGIDIDACVLASAYEAFDLGYEVKILEELSRSHWGEKLNNAALEIINKNIQKK